MLTMMMIGCTWKEKRRGQADKKREEGKKFVPVPCQLHYNSSTGTETLWLRYSLRPVPRSMRS
eukprot:6239142-Pyramimonas_sp.AAC.1